MQVFAPYADPYKTARVLDRKRLNKQITECGQILSAIDGTSKGWKNHPVVKMYSRYTTYLKLYRKTLSEYRDGNIDAARKTSDSIRPEDVPGFLIREYTDNMKSRLYAKDRTHYACFARYGESNMNMYFVDNEWKYYMQDK